MTDLIPPQLIRRMPEEAPGAEPAGRACPVARLRQRLRDAGLRPTRQRMLLGWFIFEQGDQHITAEDLFAHTRDMKGAFSLATVYNTLNQFSEAGLLRKVLTLGEKTIFDTHVGNHHHFLLEDAGQVVDIPDDRLDIGRLPEPPKGYRIAGVDVVIRLVPDMEAMS